MPAELEHVKGQQFVEKTKRWLEASLMVEVPFTVYDKTGQTSLEMLNGNIYRYDLRGYLRKDRTPIFIEAKDYGPVSDLNAHYDEFIGKSYSALLRYVKVHGKDVTPPYFVFAASRPFRHTDYHKLTEAEFVSKQLSTSKLSNYGFHAPSAGDSKLLNFSERIWLIIWSNRQELLTINVNPTLVVGILKERGVLERGV